MIKVNGNKINVEYFPNGESKIKDFDISTARNVIEFFYEDDRDVVHLLFVNELLKGMGLGTCNSLVIYYMPYSRMDRQIEGDFCTLPVMCKIINRMQFQRIYIVDPHSEKTLEFFRTISSDSVIEHEYIPVYPIVDWIKTIAQETDFNTDTDCLVFPDKGANEKYSKMNLLPGAHTASFNKIRNPHTGNIEKLALDIAYLSKCEKAIIVDDLCSRGGTFIGAASILKEVGVKDITLVVTHLEDTVFAGYLLDENSPVDRIYTSNSMVRKGSSEKIKILPININIH